MIRFSYTEQMDPRVLHRQFLREGASPRLYSFYPRRDRWTVTKDTEVEAGAIRSTLERLGIGYEEQVVEARFG